MKEIYLAGGCFWGVQRYIDQFDGVLSTTTGYANGPEDQITYREVCQNSGHAETGAVVNKNWTQDFKNLTSDSHI